MDIFANTYVLFSVPDLYPYVLVLATAISVLCMIIGMMAATKRKQFFSAERLKTKYGE